MKEVWKDIDGFDGYQVSNIGRVKNLNYNRTGEEKILQIADNGRKYLIICLCKDGKKYIKKVHRLVAEAFIPNPDNKPEIDHINTNRMDNTVWLNEDGSVNYDKTNLRWVTSKENSNNPLTKSKLKGSIKKSEIIGKGRSISVKQYTKDGVLVRIYPSASEAERQTKIDHSSIIACCRNKQKSAGSYLWRYAS